jgi:hypothetical protein
MRIYFQQSNTRNKQPTSGNNSSGWRFSLFSASQVESRPIYDSLSALENTGKRSRLETDVSRSPMETTHRQVQTSPHTTISTTWAELGLEYLPDTYGIPNESQEKMFRILQSQKQAGATHPVIAANLAHDLLHMVQNLPPNPPLQFGPTNALHNWMRKTVSKFIAPQGQEVTLQEYCDHIFNPFLEHMKNWAPHLAANALNGQANAQAGAPLPQTYASAVRSDPPQVDRPASKRTRVEPANATDTQANRRRTTAQSAELDTQGEDGANRPTLLREQKSKRPPPSKEVRAAGIIKAASYDPEQAYDPDMLKLFMEAFGFSRNLMADAAIRKVPERDVIFIVFPSIEIATQYLKGKWAKLVALKGVYVDFTRKYANKEESRLKQLRGRLGKLQAARAAAPAAAGTALSANPLPSPSPISHLTPTSNPTNTDHQQGNAPAPPTA